MSALRASDHKMLLRVENALLKADIKMLEVAILMRDRRCRIHGLYPVDSSYGNLASRILYHRTAFWEQNGRLR